MSLSQILHLSVRQSHRQAPQADWAEEREWTATTITKGEAKMLCQLAV